MKKLIPIYVLLIGLIANAVFPNYLPSLFEKHFFGSISYPTSLDSFTNPAATDSVATVSHSTQHANENDSITALETKVRINGDTTGGYIFGSDGTHSNWTSYPTTTNVYTQTLTSVGMATLGNLLATGSTTLQNFTGLQSTTTNATTTSLSVSNLASSIPYANSNGSLIPTTIGSGLSLASGVLTATAGTALTSTTTTYGIATTTISNIGATNFLNFFFNATTTTPFSTQSTYRVNFNGDSSAIYDVGTATVVPSGASVGGFTGNLNGITMTVGGTTAGISISGQIENVNGIYKTGHIYSITTDFSGTSYFTGYYFRYRSTSQITSISVGTTNSTLLATSTFMGVITY